MLLWTGHPGLFWRLDSRNVRNMSLNRIEQMLFDYLQRHAEERHFWQAKVRELMQKTESDFLAAADLTDGLWIYYEERSRIVPSLHEVASQEGLRRISLRNLAEHMMRIWGPVRPTHRGKTDRAGMRLDNGTQPNL
jgi:hypothetical protein